MGMKMSLQKPTGSWNPLIITTHSQQVCHSLPLPHLQSQSEGKPTEVPKYLSIPYLYKMQRVVNVKHKLSRIHTEQWLYKITNTKEKRNIPQEKLFLVLKEVIHKQKLQIKKSTVGPTQREIKSADLMGKNIWILASLEQNRQKRKVTDNNTISTKTKQAKIKHSFLWKNKRDD